MPREPMLFGLEVVLCSYTFDHPAIVSAITAHAPDALPGFRIKLFVDDNQLMHGKSRYMLERVRQLARVPSVTGYAITADALATAYGRYIGAHIEGKGNLHAKYARLGPVEVLGSCNFTIRSEANFERGVLTWNSQRCVELTEEFEEFLRNHENTRPLINV